MKRFCYIFLLAIFCATSAAAQVRAGSKSPVWEVVTVVDAPPASSDNESLQVETRDGHIYITVDRTVDVEVYTILGQLVTRRKLQPGTTRLQLGLRGIYILKSGGVTRRVSL